MELREWLIILGLALVTIIVVDGVRRLQRQRRVPRLDQVDTRSNGANRVDMDLDDEAKAAEINWELPNGGARVIRPAESEQVAPKPKLKRQEHPGASRVLAEWREEWRETRETATPPETEAAPAAKRTADQPPASSDATVASADETAAPRVEPSASAADERMAAPAPQAEPSPAERPQQVSQPAQPAPEEPAEQAPLADSADAEPTRTEPTLSALDGDEEPRMAAEPLAADPEDHDEHHDAERYRLVDLEGMGDSLKERSSQVGASMQRFGSSMKQSLAARKEQRKKDKLEKARLKAEKQAREASRRKQAEAEKAAKLAAEREQEAARQAALSEQQEIDAQDQDDPLFAPSRLHHVDSRYTERVYDDDSAASVQRPVDDSGYVERPSAEREPLVASHPVVEKALRHDINVEHARDTLSHAEEVIVISVMSRDDQGFSGSALLDLMLACGLRYSSEMGIFNRFETEDSESELQFSMVNVVKPGTFPLDAMDEFRTPGVTLLMPLPGAVDTAAAFEAMVETAMVIVRHLGGELKDENRSVMTAQTVEFARQRVQDFERRHRLHRYQAN